MKEIAIVSTKIHLVLEHSIRDHEYIAAFASARIARQYAGSAQAYKDAYADALDALDALDGASVRVWFPDSSVSKTLVLQSEV